jgi:hypothetical protein
MALAALALGACSGGASMCKGTTALVEGYCKNGEAADRCYYDHDPLDGF